MYVVTELLNNQFLCRWPLSTSLLHHTQQDAENKDTLRTERYLETKIILH